MALRVVVNCDLFERLTSVAVRVFTLLLIMTLLLLDGMPNKLIARRLAISEKTVKSHLTSIFRQIGVNDRVQAILWVERHGLRSDLLR